MGLHLATVRVLNSGYHLVLGLVPVMVRRMVHRTASVKVTVSVRPTANLMVPDLVRMTALNWVPDLVPPKVPHLALPIYIP